MSEGPGMWNKHSCPGEQSYKVFMDTAAFSRNFAGMRLAREASQYTAPQAQSENYVPRITNK